MARKTNKFPCYNCITLSICKTRLKSLYNNFASMGECSLMEEFLRVRDVHNYNAYRRRVKRMHRVYNYLKG